MTETKEKKDPKKRKKRKRQLVTITREQRNKSAIAVEIPASTHKLLRLAASNDHRTISQLIRKWIDEYLGITPNEPVLKKVERKKRKDVKDTPA